MQGFPGEERTKFGAQGPEPSPACMGFGSRYQHVRNFVHQAKGKQEILPDEEWSGLVVHDLFVSG